MSPLGKVPLLKINDKVIFESNVILEFVDEIYPPSFLPGHPLEKAECRAWF